MQEVVYIVTGANSGLGKETVKKIAEKKGFGNESKMIIVVACRSLEKARITVNEVYKNMPADGSLQLHGMEMDLSNLSSVKSFAEDILRQYESLHCIICNAGVMIPTNQNEDLPKTEDGFELNVGTNYVGHFLLIQLLKERLQKSAPSRVIFVSSILLKNAQLNFNLLSPITEISSLDLEPDSDFYAESKLMCALATRELSKILNPTLNTQTPIEVNSENQVLVLCVSPGWCKTNLHRNSHLPWYKYPLMLLVAAVFMKSAKKGCQTIFYCATESKEKLETAKFYRQEQISTEIEKFLDTFPEEKCKEFFEKSFKAIKAFI